MSNIERFKNDLLTAGSELARREELTAAEVLAVFAKITGSLMALQSEPIEDVMVMVKRNINSGNAETLKRITPNDV